MGKVDWTRDELVLALELYIRRGRKGLRASDPDVLKLSYLLNQLDIYPVEERPYGFRSPGSVKAKLENLKRYDPNYPHEGLGHVGGGDRLIWQEYSDDGGFDRLASEAKRIERRADTSPSEPHPPVRAWFPRGQSS